MHRYRLHETELNSIRDSGERGRRLIELNIIEQCISVYKTGIVQQRRVDAIGDSDIPYPSPTVHAVIFDPKRGVLNELEVCFTCSINSFEHSNTIFLVPLLKYRLTIIVIEMN